jgi:hypothetical protein
MRGDVTKAKIVFFAMAINGKTAKQVMDLALIFANA